MKPKQRVLLTGGSGMVGMNILNHISSTQWDFFSPGSRELNLTNFENILSYLDKVEPDIVVHAAGYVGGINANLSHPVDYLINNLDIGKNVILASKRVGIKKLLNFGASCMYPRNAPNPLTEGMILQGELEPTNEGYALAKIVTTRLCEYINIEDTSFQYNTMIPCNIYGEFDKFDQERSHLIPAIINKLYDAIKHGCSEVEIWGDGKARREFMYAGDLADAVFYALDNFDNMPQLLNIGVGKDYTVNEYYAVIADIMGFKGTFVHNIDKPVGMQQKLVSIDRQKEWGWSPTVGLHEGVKKAYNYYAQEIK